MARAARRRAAPPAQEEPRKPSTRAPKLRDGWTEATIDDAIRGTACLETARLGGLALPVRALSDDEIREVDHIARAILGADDPIVLDRMRVRLRERLALCRSILDPSALAMGRREPFFRELADLEGLPASMVSELLVAQVRAQRRAYPHVGDDQGAEALNEQLKYRARTHGFDVARARHSSPIEFFGVRSSIEVTGWQAVWFAWLSAA